MLMNPPDGKTYVTQPSLPPLDDFVSELSGIWDRKWLTNNGECHQRLEQALAEYLGVRHVSLFCNGTIALQVGLQALEITGEVITTPFSFPATTHALWWNHCTSVFCDIDPIYGNLNPAKIEALITPETTAILPVHVYGTPCDVAAIQEVADRHGLKVFYDAAHAFGVKSNGVSVLNHGDLSMLSFHATKVFNTAEGGALITDDRKMKERIDRLKNFGYVNETTVSDPGVNGKMSEIHAALGLVNLKSIDQDLEARRMIAQLYRTKLTGVAGLSTMAPDPDVIENGSYFPIRINKKQFGCSRDQLYERLKTHGVYARRYFYPLISSLDAYSSLPSAKNDCLPVANKLASEVLCLPIFPSLSEDQVHQICQVVLE